MHQKASFNQLIERHRSLDLAIRDNREYFLSDWNGGHPFIERFLGPDLIGMKPSPSTLAQYIFFDEEQSIIEAIRSFHLKLEVLALSSRNIVAGPGSSSFLVAMSLWLRQQGYNEIHYIPPLYYTFHYFLELLGIRLSPVSEKQVFEPGSRIKLPSKKTVLLLCDPVWYAGRRVPLEKIQEIAEWQKQTNSIVFVDGSFQYIQWDRTRREHTALLDPELTFRLICPTKSLAVPFFRFAYLLHPSRIHDDLVFLYESIVGGATVADRAFAHRALEVLNSDENNGALADFLKNTYSQLIERDLIKTKIKPECGYFVFAAPTVQLTDQVAMDQDYFELSDYPGYVRINLMAAHRILLSSVSA
jgi:aspartate/methionine/tyrosine aminotransferase